MRTILLSLSLLLGCAATRPETRGVEVTRVDAAPGVAVTVLDVGGTAVVWLDESAVTP